MIVAIYTTLGVFLWLAARREATLGRLPRRALSTIIGQRGKASVRSVRRSSNVWPRASDGGSR